MKNYILSLVLLFWNNCSANNAEFDNSIKIAWSTEIKISLIDTVYFKSSRIVPLETTDESLLRKIDRINYDNEKIFVFDASLNKIVIFSKTGKYLSDIHKVGGGPGEYQSVMDFCLDVDSKNILLLCDRPYKIMRFDYSGNYLEEKRLTDLYFNIISDSGYIYCNNKEINSTYKRNYDIVCMDRDLKIIHELLDMRKDIKPSNFFSGRNLTLTFDILYSRIFDNSIYCIANGTLQKKYEINFKKHTLPQEMQKSSDYTNISRESGYVYSITDMSESKNFLMFRTNLGIFIYDKNTHVLEGYRIIENSQLKTGNNDYLPVGYVDNTIAQVVQPHNIISIKNFIKKRSDIDSKLIKLIETLKEDDNPILIFYDFKNEDLQ